MSFSLIVMVLMGSVADVPDVGADKEVERAIVHVYLHCWLVYLHCNTLQGTSGTECFPNHGWNP